MSKLIIEEPPLQVLPSLAIAIGLNEAIVLQQLHYLLRDPRFGKRIAEHQWIFNTVEEWRCRYFPFWHQRTIKTIFSNLSRLGLVVTCQPEGRVSRRKYYRIDSVKLAKIAERAKFVPSMVQESSNGNGQNSSLPSTKTTSETTGTKKSKESKETPFDKGASGFSEFKAEWKPINGTKEEQLRRIEPPIDYPSEEEFDGFMEDEELDQIAMGKRANLYYDLCRDKWHRWDGRKWRKILSWEKYVRALNEKMEDATVNGGVSTGPF